jgi:hypothetical protein
VGNTVPIINNSQQATKNFGVEMYSSLMGNFDFMSPIQHINAISSDSSSSMRSIPFHTTYFNDPSTLPSSNMSYKGSSEIGMEMPLSTAKVAYQVVQEATTDLDPSSSWKDEVDCV